MHGPLHSFKNAIVNYLSKVGFGLGQGFEKSMPTLKKELERRAVSSSADYFEQKMQDTSLILNTHKELLQYAISRCPTEGSVLEFGVYKANTLNFFADYLAQRKPNQKVWGFDSFEGLPNDWAGYVITKETFDMGGNMPKVRPNVALVKGYFDAVLPGWIEKHGSEIEQIALLHIDSDLYESCQVVLGELKTGIIKGTYILFDEYFNYPGWQNHEYKAFQEFCQAENLKYKYLACYEQKVLVEIL
jgi:hypothetical protein